MQIEDDDEDLSKKIIAVYEETKTPDIEKPIIHYSINDFIPIAKLGSGSFGEVYLVENPCTKQQYAMKVLDKKEIF
jgi:serine/threonine protein kinase